MVEFHIGRHGVILLVACFLLLGAEDVLIWLRTGTLPAVEFFLASVLVLGVLAVAVREAVIHPPTRR